MLMAAGRRVAVPGLVLAALVPVAAESEASSRADGPPRSPLASAVVEPTSTELRRQEPTGQEAADPELGLREFLVEVLARSLDAEAADRRREAAGHEADALRSPLNPTLEAEGPDAGGEFQLQLLQPLRIFGQGEARQRASRARRALAARRLTAEHASVAREAARAYVETVADRRELTLAEHTLRLRRAVLERAEAALRRGWGGREELQQLRLEARAAARQVEALEDAARRKLQRLNHLLDRPADARLGLADELAGDPDRARLPPVPDELPPDAPSVALVRADADLADAELARARTASRPVPAVGPMVSLGDGVGPGVGLQLTLPLWNRNRQGTEAARSRLEASRLAFRATRRSSTAAYQRLQGRRQALSRQLERLRSRELRPARREVERWTSSRELGLPVTDRRRRARARLLELQSEEADLRRRLALLEVDAAWRSGSLLSWLRDPAGGPPGAGGE